ncbi:MAG TPA: Mur ligase family protein [Actinomycetota bacterium]|nr:Mur ligase family protein [Actinomycetota bacterium]
MAAPARTVELRVLEGPNLYFPRPAVKLTLDVPGWVGADASKVAAVASAIGLRGIEPGVAGSERRLRATARIAVAVTKRIAAAVGTRRLAIRGRTDARSGVVVVAFPWRRRGAAEALARAVADAMAVLLRRSAPRVLAEAARAVEAAEPGEEPSVPEPEVPVVQVTGTNGKTTTTRLLAHLVTTAGRRVAFSSTDGVYRDGRLVKKGDYSGFGGAATALAQRPDVAVLETARGGILLRGIGVQHNDVAVVTNVSADHLDLHGITTVDQLAEVKATVTRITRPDGWDVLNADDPRVLAMRRGATGRSWLFSLDPRHPALRDALAEGGRAMTVLDGTIVWIEGSTVHPLVALERVPMTLAGLSRMYTQNALAAAAAGLGVGLPPRSVAKGLRTFVLDPTKNPGRTNLFWLDRRVIVLDYAHNEAGMDGLVEILRGLRRPRSEIWLAIGTAGDRTDAILHGFAVRAALGVDHLAIAEQLKYLRGRSREDVIARLREGAARAGKHDIPVYPDEMRALRGMLKTSSPGDVVGITALAQRAQAFRWLRSKDARMPGPAEVRRLVRAVRDADRTPA